MFSHSNLFSSFIHAGKIVFFSLGGFCSHAEKVKTFEAAGAVGAIFGELSEILPSWDSLAQDAVVAPTIGIGVNMVSIAVSNFILANAFAGNPNLTFTATITYQQDSVYEWTHTSSFYFIMCFISIWLAVCALMALAKLLLFVKEQGGLRLSVPQLCLGMAIIAAVTMIFSMTLNFLGSRNNTTQLTMVVFRELPSIFWVFAALVFPFYWGELVSSTQPVIGLKESRIPFLIAFILMFAMTCTVTVIKGLYGSNRDLIYAQLCMVTIILGLVGFYMLFQGLRVIISLARMQDGFARTPVQKRTTFVVLSLTVLLFAHCIAYACTFSAGIGIVFPDFMMWYFASFVITMLGLAVMVLTLSPKAMKEAGVKVSAYLSGVSGTDSGIQSANDVEMGSKSRTPASSKATSNASDEQIDAQMSDTKVAL